MAMSKGTRAAPLVPDGSVRDLGQIGDVMWQFPTLGQSPPRRPVNYRSYVPLQEWEAVLDGLAAENKPVKRSKLEDYLSRRASPEAAAKTSAASSHSITCAEHAPDVGAAGACDDCSSSLHAAQPASEGAAGAGDWCSVLGEDRSIADIAARTVAALRSSHDVGTPATVTRTGLPSRAGHDGNMRTEAACETSPRRRMVQATPSKAPHAARFIHAQESVLAAARPALAAVQSRRDRNPQRPTNAAGRLCIGQSLAR